MSPKKLIDEVLEKTLDAKTSHRSNLSSIKNFADALNTMSGLLYLADEENQKDGIASNLRSTFDDELGALVVNMKSFINESFGDTIDEVERLKEQKTIPEIITTIERLFSDEPSETETESQESSENTPLE